MLSVIARSSRTVLFIANRENGAKMVKWINSKKHWHNYGALFPTSEDINGLARLAAKRRTMQQKLIVLNSDGIIDARKL